MLGYKRFWDVYFYRKPFGIYKDANEDWMISTGLFFLVIHPNGWNRFYR
jgi:hypothetical protein